MTTLEQLEILRRMKKQGQLIASIQDLAQRFADDRYPTAQRTSIESMHRLEHVHYLFAESDIRDAVREQVTYYITNQRDRLAQWQPISPRDWITEAKRQHLDTILRLTRACYGHAAELIQRAYLRMYFPRMYAFNATDRDQLAHLYVLPLGLVAEL